MTNHLAAIHVLKSKLRMSEDDYRALLANLTGKTSAKALTDAERGRVRAHMQALGEKLGVASPRWRGAGNFKASAQYRAATPMERKVHAMWSALTRAGVIRNGSKQALRAWVKRQTGCDALQFCTAAQMHALIEALKEWQQRAEERAQTGRNALPANYGPPDAAGDAYQSVPLAGRGDDRGVRATDAAQAPESAPRARKTRRADWRAN